MILYDYHLHSEFSGDSETPAREQIEEALRRGLKGVCFTDHMDLEYPNPVESGTDFLFDIDEYIPCMRKLRDEYAGKIEIMIGMEAGLRNEPGMLDRMDSVYNEYARKYDLDFVIGSVHCLENIDPVYPAYWEGKSIGQGLGNYFKAIVENCRNYTCFDTAAHFDYLVRYVPKSEKWHGIEDYHPEDFSDIVDEFLKTLIARGKSLECNAAGLKYGLGFAHPHDFILKRYLELGGELLTIGSDGHKPEHLAYDFDKVCDHLKSVGYKYYTVYKARKPEFIKL